MNSSELMKVKEPEDNDDMLPYLLWLYLEQDYTYKIHNNYNIEEG